MTLILFSILWLVSPIILLVLLSIQIGKTNDLKKENKALQEKIKFLMEEREKYIPNAEASPADPAAESGSPVETASEAVSDPASPPDHIPVQNSQSVQDSQPVQNPQPVQPSQTSQNSQQVQYSTPAQNPQTVQNSQPVQNPSPLPYDMPYLIPRVPPQQTANRVGTQPENIPESVFSSVENTVSGTAAPQYAKPGLTALSAPEKKSVSTINIILILGALLISLAGFIFASATWDSLNMFFKTALLLSFSAVFFGIHSLAERKLKLEQTGRVFYILGSIFLPAAIAAAGFLKVFGEYFSFYGEGRAAVFAAMFFSVSATFFKGAHDYKFRAFAAVSFGSFSASAVSLIWQLSPVGDVTALCMAVFALAVILTEPLVIKLFSKMFGEESVFVPEWKRFSSLNAWVLSVISLFAAKTGFVSLAAFAIFSVCFLRKSVTDRDGTAGTLAFAFFIVAALYTGFEPGEASEFTMIIAAVSLIYAVLSAMGLFPDAVRLIMRILAMIAAGIALAMGIIENIVIISRDEIPSLTLIFAAAAVFAQLLVLALRHKTAEYKGMSFAAMMWLSAEIMLFISGHIGGRDYIFAASYGFMLIYFAVIRFTKLRERLYTAADDIIIAAYAFLCVEICVVRIDSAAGIIIGLGILLAGIVLSAVSKQEKLSEIICPVLAGSSFFPLLKLFDMADAVSEAASASGTVVILLCVAAGALLFVPKARKYAKSYTITAAASVPVFILISVMEWHFYCIPMLAVIAYMVVYLFKHAFPREKYSHIDVLFTAIILTSFFVGGNFTDGVYLLCFPAVALMLIFAVYVLASSMGGFEKIGEYTEKFLWFVMPVFSGILMIFAESEESFPVMIFGVILLICSVFTSMFRKNTMNLIFPLFIAFAVLSREHAGDNGTAAAIGAAILAASGRLMFSRKLTDKLYSDVLSISSLAFCGIFIAKEDSDLNLWIGLILLAAAVANLIRREHSVRSNKMILTAASAFIFLIWWTIPFFDIPSLIELEWNLLPAVIFCVILRLIWREAPEKAYNFSFVTAIVCLAILFIGALSTGKSFDSVFIGVVLLIMLAVSFIIKRKRWFVLAVTSMVISAALLSIRQLDSIAWLVYLVLTGAALIALGVVNEIKKQQKRSGEETKLTRFMSDWTW